MFTRLYVDNYKCLVNFDLPLRELTLLLGQNGVGKTSVLDVVYALQQLLGGVAKVTDPQVFPTRTLTRWQSKDSQVFEADVELEGDSFSYRIEVEHNRSTQLARIKEERLTAGGKPLFRCEMGEVQLYRDNHSEGPVFTVDWGESALARVAPRGDDNRRLTRFLEFVRKVVVCGFYPSGFKAESATEDARLDRDARNFVGWYRHVLQERQDLVPGFNDAMQEVVHGFKGTRLEKVGLDTRALMVVFEDHGERFELRLDEISDGQRALVALYALTILTADQGYSLFLDEPDNYVALREIQPWLVGLEDGCGETIPQAVLCSHHPECIDYLGVDSGLLLKRESSGATRAEGLADTLRHNQRPTPQGGVVQADELADAPAEGGLKLSEIVARGWEQ